ncbi:hypothetical protein CC85DRAFT_328215 [Cutaneotrichosporon oleaginosum]|uniref:Uncharacterized protein n=1 Tax=Cutaneotrichosporon oleaginosum TaxID=879819 RepID=A0A0J0XN13_9TREE|nr:uncharacterized protein CC85DRAFT_328215 [Cutaneotrichosporon oleaginosum]KLT42482.1 hypothetical protein CC85DRAFT_328215 [Cutaneotrichosporon oleaginosum]TXT07001.1 hypothetical protein COLE_06332 [Cutaneotrichosporon oleaginosum]
MPRLDVETDEQRRERLGTLFSALSSPSPPTNSDPFPTPSKPFAIPESDALARARAFLPLMAASNAELAARKERGEDVAIDGRLRRDLEAAGGERQDGEGEGEGEEGEENEENEEGDEGRQGTHVEMDVGLGVFDVKGDVAGDVGPVVEREAEVWTGQKEGASKA